MSRLAELLRSRRVPQVAVLALMSVGFAGCSADMQTRFPKPFSIPLLRSPKPPVRCRAPAVERREPPQYSRPQASSAPQYQSQPLPAPAVASAARLSGQFGRGVRRRARDFVLCAAIPFAASRPPARCRRARSQPPRPAAQNGTTIIVGTSDTLDLVAKRYNVSAAAILQANGYKGPACCRPASS